MLQTFLPQFCMTFFIVLFILLMQFLFRYINDLVGRGLEMHVLAELFFYAALSFIPMALPLAILLASLMTFGNLGEHVELTALKSAGISLVRVMQSLIIFIVTVAVGAFFFQNDVLPQTQVKMYTLLFSARQTSLSLEITKGTINSQIPGYNVYVKDKNPKTGMLYDVIIYGVDQPSAYPRIVTADSGMLSTTKDEKHILLKLYRGNWYEDVKQGNGSFGKEMYRRESFHDKEIMIPYDATFKRMDDNNMRSQYIGKNIKELVHTIDSVQRKVDSIGVTIANELKASPMCGVQAYQLSYSDSVPKLQAMPDVKMDRPIDFDSIYDAMSTLERQQVVNSALNTATSTIQNAEFRSYSINEDNAQLRRHGIELQKKFTLSLACLIFFFIGAPLGAIIRKGGLGLPIVISIILFVIYYIIDNSGYKMARDGYWPVWQGIWLSSAVLLPLGVFLTYKAVNDSAVFDLDSYLILFRRFFGGDHTRHLEKKEMVVDAVEDDVAIAKMEHVKEVSTEALAVFRRRPSYVQFFKNMPYHATLQHTSDVLEESILYLGNSMNQLIINKAMDFPYISNPWVYRLLENEKMSKACFYALPVGACIYLYSFHQRKKVCAQFEKVNKVAQHVIDIVNGVDDNHQAH
ncbi:MAG: LptF/LptG family permease [Bacteroidales bacterium]|nr:LptF/LptG family permease [Bacteroidales bacterium]